MSIENIVIVSAVRTAIGDFGKTLKDIPATDLGAYVIKEAIKRAGIDPLEIDEVIMGNIFQAGQRANPSRQAAVKAGVPYEVPALTVNNQCASAMRAITAGAHKIVAGDAQIIVAGGMENMSRIPYVLTDARWGYRLGSSKVYDHMLYDGLICAFCNYHMGVTAENLAQKYNITREEQDRLAYESHMRAIRAIKEGKFKEEIVPVKIKTKDKEFIFEVDEHPREDTTIEKLAKLPPVFKKDGTVTAGNASAISDGAAAVVIMSEEKARKLGIEPLARLVACSVVGVKPEIMGWGPVPATQKALKKAGLKLEDIQLVELNEAFAAQALACIKGLNLDTSIVNVNGSGISLGHPVGATGCRIVVTLIYEMIRRKVRYGLATLCQGGGMGSALIIENLRL